MMNPEARAQLTQALKLAGAAAWCVCATDGSCEHHCYTDWFKPAQLESITTKLAVAVAGLRRHQLEPVQVCWVFEHTRLFVAQRADGRTLALFVENRPELVIAAHQAAVAGFIAGE